MTRLEMWLTLQDNMIFFLQIFDLDVPQKADSEKKRQL